MICITDQWSTCQNFLKCIVFFNVDVLSDISPNDNNKYTKVDSKQKNNSDGDDSSMDSNPAYGDYHTGDHMMKANSIKDEDEYHTLQFEQKPGNENEQSLIIDGNNNYHTLQHLDHKPKYDQEDSGSVYYSTPYIADTPDYVNGFVQKVDRASDGRGGGSMLRIDMSECGQNMEEFENVYDSPDEGYSMISHVEHFGSKDIVLEPNKAYSSLSVCSHEPNVAYASLSEYSHDV